MAGGIQLPQALQLISGVPLAKVGSVFAEKLSITKRLDGAVPSSVLKRILSDGNLSSVMQNPMAGLTGALQGQLGQMASQLGGISGAGGLISGLTGSGGLSAALTSFQGAGDNLAGLTNGAAGFFQMLGHEQTAQMAGDALPSQFATSVVTGPLTAQAVLANIQATLPGLIAQVANGTATPVSVLNWVQGQIATINAIVANSSAALAWSAANHALIAAAATVAGALTIPPTFDASGYRQNGAATGFQGVLQSLVRLEVAATLAAAAEAQIGHTRHDPIDVGAMTSLGDG